MYLILRGGSSKIFSGKSLAAILSEIDNLFRNSVAISVNKESKLLYEPALPEPLPKLTIQEGKLLANSFPEEIINISGKRALIATSTFSINIGPLFKEYQISAPIQTSKNLTVELILPVNF